MFTIRGFIASQQTDNEATEMLVNFKASKTAQTMQTVFCSIVHMLHVVALSKAKFYFNDELYVMTLTSSISWIIANKSKRLGFHVVQVHIVNVFNLEVSLTIKKRNSSWLDCLVVWWLVCCCTNGRWTCVAVTVYQSIFSCSTGSPACESEGRLMKAGHWLHRYLLPPLPPYLQNTTATVDQTQLSFLLVCRK